MVESSENKILMVNSNRKKLSKSRGLLTVNAIAVLGFIAICFIVPLNIYVTAMNQYILLLLWFITAYMIDKYIIKDNAIFIICIFMMCINGFLHVLASGELSYVNKFLTDTSMFLIWPIMFRFTAKNYSNKLIKKVVLLSFIMLLISLITTNIGLNMDPSASRMVTRLTMGAEKVQYLKKGIGGYGFVYAVCFVLAALVQYMLYTKTQAIKILLVGGIAFGVFVIIRTNFTIAVGLSVSLITFVCINNFKKTEKLLINILSFFALAIVWTYRIEIINQLIDITSNFGLTSIHYKMSLFKDFVKMGDIERFSRIELILDGLKTAFKYPFIGCIWFDEATVSGHSGFIDYIAQYGINSIWLIVFFVAAFRKQRVNVQHKVLKMNLRVIQIGGGLFGIFNTFLIYREIAISVFYIVPLIFFILQSDAKATNNKLKVAKNTNIVQNAV